MKSAISSTLIFSMLSLNFFLNTDISSLNFMSSYQVNSKIKYL